VGVIPKALNEKGIVYESCDELVSHGGHARRKAEMDARSDAFIALPGGFGTIEEIMEIITLKQLSYHDKPIVLLNIGGYYDMLLGQFETIIAQQFAKPQCRELFLVTDSVAGALDYIDAYVPDGCRERWLTDVEAPCPESRGPGGASCLGEAADDGYCKLEVFIPKTHLALLQDTLRAPTRARRQLRQLPVVPRCGPAAGGAAGSSPYEGEHNVVCEAGEYKVEVICLKSRAEETIRVIREIHPYEMPVINAIPLFKTGF
jgi:hypothetical protein